MIFLLDMPVSPSLVPLLEEFNLHGIHVSKIGMGAASDAEILQKARDMQAVIITADPDFPRMLALSAAEGPGLILFRGGNYSDAEMRDLLRRVLKKIELNVLKNSICVVDKENIRITRLPIKS